MSPRDGWYPPSSPLPVDDGIRARSRRGPIGESWWSRRFLDLLESFGMGGRFDRGRTYARKGQVISLEVEPGTVSALVQGSRPRPYRVRIALPRLSEADWRRAEDAMVSRAAFLAKLLAGDMPEDIEEAFVACSLDLFPAARDDLTTSCSCPDWANPCKHIAAVYLLLAEAFDEDPFLILGWRGRARHELLGNLRALRGSVPAPSDPEDADDQWASVVGADVPPLADRVDDFWEVGAELTGMRLDPSPPEVADAVLRGLQPLERDAAGRPLADLLAPAYEATTVTARDRLLGDAPEA